MLASSSLENPTRQRQHISPESRTSPLLPPPNRAFGDTTVHLPLLGLHQLFKIYIYSSDGTNKWRYETITWNFRNKTHRDAVPGTRAGATKLFAVNDNAIFISYM